MGSKRLSGIGPALISAAVALAAAFFPMPLGAEPGGLPLPILAPSTTRGAILRSAEQLLGTPYRFGGETRKGLDCSGYVSLVFEEATGHPIPRTVAEQGAWVMLIPRRELKPGDLVFFDLDPRPLGAQNGSSGSLTSSAIAAADHVGIYSGDGYFLHAASAGLKTGVIRNSLSEPAWARRFLFAGRVVSASALSGFALDWGFSASFDAEPAASLADLPEKAFRGAGLRLAATLPLGANFSIGLEGRVEWDRLLNIARLPLELLLGQNTGFAIFAGPALTLGSPRLLASETGSTDRSYEAAGGWIASAGIRWSPIFIRSGASGAGIFAELRFDHYLPAPGQPADLASDRKAALSLAIGLRYRSVHY